MSYKLKGFYLLLLCFSIALASCKHKEKQNIVVSKSKVEYIHKLEPAFQDIIDSAGVSGSVLIFDLQNNSYHSNDFEWASNGHLPASTFKIVNSIIALETGVIKNENKVFIWDGKKRALESWERDLDFRDAFQFSCVPCYQEVARNIGSLRMNAYLSILEYGHMQVDSSNIDLFWLEGDSKINQYEQIDFLRRMYLSKLPISKSTEAIIKELMLIKKNDDYSISAKTGWSIRNGNNNGWFVGYLESKGNVFFFATNIEPGVAFNMDLFNLIRKDITYEALKQMNAF